MKFKHSGGIRSHETVKRDPDLPPGMQGYSQVRTEMEVECPPPKTYRPGTNGDAERNSHQPTRMKITTMPRRNLSDKDKADEKKRNIRFCQSQYSKILFGGLFEEDWITHLDEFEDLCEDFDIAYADRTGFLRYTVKDDAKKFYKGVHERNRSWSEMKSVFGHRYASLSKQEEVFMSLEDLTIGELKRNGCNYHSALETLFPRINELVPLAKAKDREGEAKVRDLRGAVVGTEWGYVN